MEFHNPQLLPIIPERLRRERHVFEKYDTRFRAAARMLQAIWRERKGLPSGHFEAKTGKRRRLGSMLATEAATTGANFLSSDIFGQARCDLAYREPGALIDAHRLWTNLLSSMPLAFNLLTPLKNDKALARRVLSKLGVETDIKQVCHLQFEHAPGRGDPTFTADGTAFDALASLRTNDGRKIFAAIEIKYSESLTEPEARLRPRYNELSRASGLFIDPESEALRCNPLQSFWRGHMLAQSMVDTGLYDGGVFILIAPRQNRDVQRAASRYQTNLRDDGAKVRFVVIDLEDAIAAIGASGAKDHAIALSERYTNFAPVHDLVRAACFTTPRRKRGAQRSTRRGAASRPPTRPTAQAQGAVRGAG